MCKKFLFKWISLLNLSNWGIFILYTSSTCHIPWCTSNMYHGVHLTCTVVYTLCTCGVRVVYHGVHIVCMWCSCGVPLVMYCGVHVVCTWCLCGVSWCACCVHVVSMLCLRGVPLVMYRGVHVVFTWCTMVYHGVHIVCAWCTMVYMLCACGVQELLNTSYLYDCQPGNDITASF